MTDIEFQILDELYFVCPFDKLQALTGIERDALKMQLAGLYQKDWIKCFRSVSEELSEKEVDFEREIESYFFLATKKGLLAHNSTN